MVRGEAGFVSRKSRETTRDLKPAPWGDFRYTRTRMKYDLGCAALVQSSGSVSTALLDDAIRLLAGSQALRTAVIELDQDLLLIGVEDCSARADTGSALGKHSRDRQLPP